MPPAALARCLDSGLDPDAWYALVNSRVFFWLSRERLDRHRAACGKRPQIILDAWRETRWLTEARDGHAPRPRSHPPAELAIDHAVPDIMDFVIASRVTLAPVMSNTVRAPAETLP